MLRDLFDLIGAFFSRVIHSRLFPVTLAFVVMFSTLVIRLFDLQIMNAGYYQERYKEKTLATIEVPSTRGIIYDCENRVLAYNQLTYDVTIQDVGAYPTNAEKNTVALSLVRLLDRMGTDTVSYIPLAIDEDGSFVYTSRSNAAKRRFYRDFLGVNTINDMQDKDNDPYEWSADELVTYLKKRYYFSKWVLEDKTTPVETTLTDQELLKVLNIRYALAQKMYRKYELAVVAENVDAKTVAAVMEYGGEMKGVTIQENNERVYPYGRYLASIIGYTGAASEEELEELQLQKPGYELGDIVGKAGIEEIMELELQGEKGQRVVYKDSTGNVLEELDYVAQTSGNNVYLTIDAEKTVGIYHLMEQMLAGILLDHMVNHDVEKIEQKDPDIPVKDVYIHLISNNVLDLELFEEASASEPEQRMFHAFAAERDRVLSELREQLTDDPAPAYETLSKQMQEYNTYLYSNLMVTSLGLINADAINRQDEIYKAWKAGTISFREFLHHAIEEDWMDTEILHLGEKYSSTDQIFGSVVDFVLADAKDDRGFAKLIYQSLINGNKISGNDVCAALYYQKVLPEDEGTLNLLLSGNGETAFDFVKDKICNLEITPAQLALDPCSGAVVVTDVDTGKIKIIMTYPGYDNNMFSGTVDAEYYQSLLDDASLPLFNRATLSTMAPGSTFKMITAAAALEEGYVYPSEIVDCTKVFEKVTPNPNCWVAAPGHGEVEITKALAYSCNYYFYEMGYRFCQLPDLTLNLKKGVETIARYAAMFGLDRKTGIEIGEAAPHITDTEPIASAIGQGTNAFSTVHLSRYVTGIASRGNIYQLSLLDHVESAAGKVTKEFEPVIESTVELSDTTWNYIWQGMYNVVHSGTIVDRFMNCDLEVAAKTGTAQEDLTRSEHAQFVSFAPYDDPEITVTITIMNGYTSGNNAYLGNDVYEYWYDYMNTDDIMARKAFFGSGSAVDD